MQQKRIFNDKYDEIYPPIMNFAREMMEIKISSSPPAQFCRALMAWR